AVDAGDVQALLAFGHGAAEDDVLDLGGVERRHPRQRGGDGRRGEIVGTGVAQRAVRGLADGRADGSDDDGFRHGGRVSLLGYSLSRSAIVSAISLTWPSNR